MWVRPFNTGTTAIGDNGRSCFFFSNDNISTFTTNAASVDSYDYKKGYGQVSWGFGGQENRYSMRFARNDGLFKFLAVFCERDLRAMVDEGFNKVMTLEMGKVAALRRKWAALGPVV